MLLTSLPKLLVSLYTDCFYTEIPVIQSSAILVDLLWCKFYRPARNRKGNLNMRYVADSDKIRDLNVGGDVIFGVAACVQLKLLNINTAFL